VTLIYGILRFSNFAHGDTMAFGAMVTILFTWGCSRSDVSLGPLPTALLALPVGIVGDRASGPRHRPRGLSLLPRTQKAKPVIFVIVSIGVMFILNGIVRFIIGVDDQRFADGERFIISARDFRELDRAGGGAGHSARRRG
jgi:branched-chain amino acid transport system permease protein